MALDLRSRTRRRGLEHAVTLDVETGEQIGSMLAGTATSTDISLHLRLMRADRGYVVLHTHPLSTSFSQFDLLLFAEHQMIRVIVAVGVDQTWYIVSNIHGAPASNPRDVFDDLIRERVRLLQDEESDISHRATEVVAARHNLRYDHIAGTPDEHSTS